MSLIFVDCEGHGPCPGLNDTDAFEFGAVEYASGDAFYSGKGSIASAMQAFAAWLEKYPKPVFVSDNPAYDWQWINYYFHHYLGYNPMGHSARRISDFYAGLQRNWRDTQSWKRWRSPAHNHHPVVDAFGNANAFRKILERYKLRVPVESSCPVGPPGDL